MRNAVCSNLGALCVKTNAFAGLNFCANPDVPNCANLLRFCRRASRLRTSHCAPPRSPTGKRSQQMQHESTIVRARVHPFRNRHQREEPSKRCSTSRAKFKPKALKCAIDGTISSVGLPREASPAFVED